MVLREIRELIIDSKADSVFIAIAYAQAKRLKSTEQFKLALGERWLRENLENPSVGWAPIELPPKPGLIMTTGSYLIKFRLLIISCVIVLLIVTIGLAVVVR